MAVKKKKAVKKAVTKKAKAPTKKRTTPDASRAMARAIAAIASDHKALDIVVLDLRGLTSFTDYFVIASGASDRQVQAIADAIHGAMKKGGRLPISEEGVRSGHWALIDYGDVVAHVFYPTDREHYQLERLWHDAPRITLAL